jgi:hypothetical protein
VQKCGTEIISFRHSGDSLPVPTLSSCWSRKLDDDDSWHVASRILVDVVVVDLELVARPSLLFNVDIIFVIDSPSVRFYHPPVCNSYFSRR